MFAGVEPLELAGGEIEAIYKIARLKWGAIDPAIIGTLFERGMDPDKRAELGSHCTGHKDIAMLVEPVLMAPLRRRWAEVKAEALRAIEVRKAKLSGQPRAKTRKGDPGGLRSAREIVWDFLQYLQSVTVLDPACGSGNFLYVSLQKLKDLEKEILIFASRYDLDDFLPRVGPRQFYGIEKSPYAFDLARMTVWIGWIQWTRANGYKVNDDPILTALENINNTDAILDMTDPEHPHEPEWPDAQFIVGNPPFLGDKKMRGELGDQYVSALRKLFGDRIPAQSDLCCYWFEKARDAIERGKSRRVGLLATQGIRGGASRQVLERIKESGDIFFAESDREWIQKGVNVHVSMIGFDGGEETARALDGEMVSFITPSLTANVEHHRASILPSNQGISFIGPSPHAKFDIPEDLAISMITDSPNPTGVPNSDVIRPVFSSVDLVSKNRNLWTIDFGNMSVDSAIRYEAPFEYVSKFVKPQRFNKRGQTNPNWWQYERPRPELREKIEGSSRYIVTPRYSKYRIFTLSHSHIFCNDGLIVFSLTDEYSLGILHSRIHEIWALKQSTRLETRPRYTPTTCFETFPFPGVFAGGLQVVIGETAKDLVDSRESWLKPPEWTREEILEFPGSANGPWRQLVYSPDEKGVGTVRYVRRVPKDAGCAAKLAKRTLTSLYNKRVTWLDETHRRLDDAVFAAYGWKPDLTDDEILSRLLALNLERARIEGGAVLEPPRVAMATSDPSEHVD